MTSRSPLLFSPPRPTRLDVTPRFAQGLRRPSPPATPSNGGVRRSPVTPRTDRLTFCVFEGFSGQAISTGGVIPTTRAISDLRAVRVNVAMSFSPDGGRGRGVRVPSLNRLLGRGLIGVAAVSALFAPRLLDYALGVLFLAVAARGLWGSSRPPEEPAGPPRSVTWQVTVVGVVGLFGGGAIAWGWLTAARAVAGVVALALLATAYATPREQRDTGATGCAVLLGLFAVTGWLGLFPPYLEEALWPGTPAGRTARGVGGYLLLWLGGLVLVGAALAGARRGPGVASGPWWAVVVAVGGFAVWLGGALYWCGAWPAESLDGP